MTYPTNRPSAYSRQGGGSYVLDLHAVQIAAAGPARQSRATVALRIILAIPHFFVLYFLGVAASAVAFIGWFGALFTGCLPDFAARYLSGYLRWHCRVAAYLLLLTDEYPPFLFRDAAYPVRVAFSPGRLNRLAVLFRLVLAVPAAILSMILMSGLATIVIFIAWLTVLIAGKLPGSLHQAFAAVLRYSARYYGYLYLLTGSYPRGLFGDNPGAWPGDLSGDPGYGMPGPGYRMTGPGYGAPDPAHTQASSYNAPPGYGTPGYTTPVPGYGQPASGYPTARVPRHRAASFKTPSQPASWQMSLSGGAKVLVAVILVLGLATTVGASISAGSVISSARHRSNEINQLNAAIAENNNAIAQNQKTVVQVNSALAQITSAHTKLGSQMNVVVEETGACSSLGCINAAALHAAGVVAGFGRRLHAVAIPPASAAAARKFVPDVTRYQQAWMSMGHSISFTDYENRAGSAEKVGRHFDHDYQALTASLSRLGSALNRQAASLNQRTASLNREAAALNAG